VSTLLGPVCNVASVSELLRERHYLGPARRGWAWSDEFGVMVFANPTSRRLPHATWLELTRWCIVGGKNAGSQQWAAVKRYLLTECPDVTTVVSYSDPSVGHTGALYRACGWLAAPTWMSLRPPPSAGGSWDGVTVQAVKDRWVYPLRRDDGRAEVLAVQDEALVLRFPGAGYREPRWRRGRWSA
jgi:hypothetical protein